MYAYIEPGQPTPGLSQPSLILAACTFLHPCDGPDPVLRLDIPEILLLVMKVWCDVVAHKGEEAGNGEGLVAVSQHFKVDGLFVVQIAEEGNDGVDGDHDEDSDDAVLVSLCAMLEVHRRTASARTASSSAWHAV